MSETDTERRPLVDATTEDHHPSAAGPAKSSMRNRTRRSRKDRAADEQVETIDFKMVSFSLGGKDYGIDIMKVKEIARFTHFTYVPNCPPFVRGVYNLRGDIISVIDLRRMFNIPVPERKITAPDGNRANSHVESGLILRLETSLIGVIVDSIDKVVGISSTSIQPPHPIFADINIKYISGVVEHEDRLYIILDVERIFSRDSEVGAAAVDVRDFDHTEMIQTGRDASVEIRSESPGTSPAPNGDVGFGFITETLTTFAGFHTTGLNREWALERYKWWKQAKGEKIQLASIEDAGAFLETFESPATGVFWPDAYAKQIEKCLPPGSPRSVQVWNPGCGKGHESYSFCCLLRKKYSDARIKIWASDKDLLSISTAPNLVFPEHEAPSSCKDTLVSGRNGYSFGPEVKDLVVFEYHDVLHESNVPDVDIILARDLLSYMKPADQNVLLSEFAERLKPGGVLIVGTNERIQNDEQWRKAGDGSISAYTKT